MIVRFLKQYWMSTILCGVVLYLCMMDVSSMPKAPMSNFDKLVHFLMFVAVAGVVFFESSRYFRTGVSNLRMLLGVLMFPVLFGGAIELLQEYCTLARNGDWMDFLFDVYGVVSCFLVCYIINQKIKK